MPEHVCSREQALDKLWLRVLDAHALGDPGFLGDAAVDLRPLRLEANAPPINVWLPLQARKHMSPEVDKTPVHRGDSRAGVGVSL